MNNFEIHNRADALSMAKDYMDRQQEIAAEFAKIAFHTALSSDTTPKGTASVASRWREYLPDTYTIAELTEKAQGMYSFVMTNKNPAITKNVLAQK